MRVHLVTTEYPIKEGQNQTSDCGAEVKKAKVCLMWDEQAMGQGVGYTRNMCHLCYMADGAPRGTRIVYGISEKPAERHEEE